MRNPDIADINQPDRSRASAIDDPHQAVCEERDVALELETWVTSTAPEDIPRMKQENRPDKVQSTTLALCLRFGRRQVSGNHCDSAQLEALRNAQHYRRWDFATQSLCVGCQHVFYQIPGGQTRPGVPIRDLRRTVVGGALSISWDTYHTNPLPKAGMLLLFQRGRIRSRDRTSRTSFDCSRISLSNSTRNAGHWTRLQCVATGKATISDTQSSAFWH